MALQIYAGLTSQTVRFFVQDTSSTSGAGLTGLTSGSSGLTAYYTKSGTGSATAITLASQTATGAWTSGGFCSVDGTNMPGVYRLDIPNAALDSEVETIIMLRGAANMAPVCLRVTGRVFASDGVKWGGSAVTGMPMPTYTQPTGFLAATFPATVSSYDGGAVASVTGNVGGNVLGSVGSVVAGVTVTTNNDKSGYTLTVTPPTAAAIADAVWDEAYAGHTTAGTFGKLMDILRKSNTVVEGTVLATPTPTASVFRISGADYPTGAMQHAVLWFASGPAIEQNNPILTWTNNGDGTVTITLEAPLVTTPTAGDLCLIAPSSHVHAIAEIQSGLATAANQGVILDRTAYALTVLAGACSDAQTAAETYTLTIGGNTFTVDYSGLDASGNRSTTTLSKV